MFPTFLENPANYKFEHQDPDEEILLVVRAHPITNYSWILAALFLFFLPFTIPSILSFLNIAFPTLPPSYIPILLIINYLLVIVISFEGFLYWYFNVNILTNERIIDFDFNSLLFKNTDIAGLDDVQECNTSQAGLLGLIFNFGTVIVQTAGAVEGIDFTNIPKANLVADMIMEQAEIFKKQEP